MLVVVLVLDQSAFSPAKRARLSRKYFVQLVGLSNIGILEDEDEHEDDSANSKFSFSPLAKSLEGRGQTLELSLKGIIYLGDDVSDHHRR